MKLLGSTEKNITKDKNSQNVPHLEITKVDWSIVILTKIINKIQDQVWFTDQNSKPPEIKDKINLTLVNN